jgi:multicomponent K+:H+ antiporter subunit D
MPRVSATEIAPIAALLILCLLQTIQAGPVMRFMQATAHSLYAPRDYVRAVLPPAEQQAGKAGGT